MRSDVMQNNLLCSVRTRMAPVAMRSRSFYGVMAMHRRSESHLPRGDSSRAHNRHIHDNSIQWTASTEDAKVHMTWSPDPSRGYSSSCGDGGTTSPRRPGNIPSGSTDTTWNMGWQDDRWIRWSCRGRRDPGCARSVHVVPPGRSPIVIYFRCAGRTRAAFFAEHHL